MSGLPKLKTGARGQYPAVRWVEYRTTVLEFVDGSEQRYREAGGPLRRWQLPLDLLDEKEWQQLEEFFEGTQGAYGSFPFQDPWDEREYPDCSFDGDVLEWELAGESRGRTSVTVRENRT